MTDLRLAFRTLSRSRGYTALAAVTLALCIGANTAIFTMANAIVNRPFVFPDLDRVVVLTTTIPKAGSQRHAVTASDYLDCKDATGSFTALAAIRPWAAGLTTATGVEPARASSVSPAFFSVLGVGPLHGRLFRTDEDEHAIVISHGFWQQRLAADVRVIGRMLKLNGVDHTVVGVMPPRIDYPGFTEIWAPMTVTREDGPLSVLGRLRPEVSLAQARLEMNQIAAGLADRYPATHRGRGIDLRLLTDTADAYAPRYMLVVSTAVAFLLVLGCANVANLQLARCAMRRKEFALRVALGASRRQLARQLFIEGLVLSLAGAGLGLPLASSAIVLIRNSIPAMITRRLPGLQYATLDAPVLLWMVLAGVITAVAFTLPAVLQIPMSRSHEVLKESGRGVAPGGGRLRSALVISEIACALVLLTAAVAMFRGLGDLSPARQGFDPSNVIAYGQGRSGPEETLRELRALPEVSAAALISDLPAMASTRSAPLLIEGQPAPPPDAPLLAELRIASADYFRVMGIPILAGRDFTPHDTANSLPIALVSQAAARRYWPSQNPLGQRLRSTDGPWLTVIGIAGNVNHFFLDTEIRPTVYVSNLQYPARAMQVLVKGSAGLTQTVAAVRHTMSRLDPAAPVYKLDSVSRFFSDLAGGVGVMAALIGVFAALSLLLSAAGVYALMHYSVAQRTREIGIRMAMGACPADVRRLIVANALKLVAVAFILGVPAAWALSRVMSRLLAGIVTLDATTLLAATLVIAATAALASYLPARRATAIDPLAAIRD